MPDAKPSLKIHSAVLGSLLTIGVFSGVAAAQTPKSSPPAPKTFSYNYAAEAKAAAVMDLDHPDAAGMRAIYAARRKRVLDSTPEGGMLLFSVDENQPRHLEYQVPQSENHDFEYLTGLAGLDSYDSALLLIPAVDGNRAVLYTSAAVEDIKAATGIDDVRPYAEMEQEQRHLYELALRVQKTVIDHIKPGAKWWDLHNLAVQMLHEEGNFDQYYKYGIGHFIGMEVHDEGDYGKPVQPGMAMAIEQGIVLPGGLHMQLEDNVIVTETGHDWISQSIPIEPDDVEKMMQTPSSFAAFANKPWPPPPK